MMNPIGTLFGRQIGQCWEDFSYWEQVLNENPQFEEIIELGTYEGGMSWFLYAQATARGMKFSTYDIVVPELYAPNFHGLDVLTMAPAGQINGVVFCDGGDKVQEAERFAPYMSNNSCLAVHDWGTEFQSKDIPEGWRPFLYGEQTVWLMHEDFLNGLEVILGRRIPEGRP